MSEHEMTTEQITHRIETLRSQNANHAERLQRMTGGQLDFLMARVEHMLEYLVKAGIVEESVYLDLNLDWEEHLKGQLTQIEENINLQMANQRAAQRAQQSGLVLPGKG